MGTPSHLTVVGDAPATEREKQTLDLVFGALSDPVRREILDRLDGQALLVSEVAASLKNPLQAVSRHNPVLERRWRVRQERTGRISRCRFDAAPIYGAALWLNRFSKYWQSQFDLLALSLEDLARDQAAKPRKRRRRKSAASARSAKSRQERSS